ncbi:MAG: Mannose-1-phosphate guanylyltransferase RfbM [Phycisphaerae bacterium]|nr:Mannose-1-phosphate guanylyltransferase RfbM [Phycisphaerae bacterium]
MRYAVIMAGGAGTRLWPMSRSARPKHFLRLFDNKSLLRISYERLAGFLPPQQICVITSTDHLSLVADDLPELPANNLLGEPAVRDTANAIGLAALVLQKRDPAGVMGIFTADHIIRPHQQFHAALECAYQAAEQFPDALLTFGIRPTSPHTGYGYLHRGAMIQPGLFKVQEFKEKPDRSTAEQYLLSGDYYWNSGMFVWRIESILQEFARHLPENLRGLQAVQRATHDQQPALYQQLPKISIDYGIMEKAQRVLLCEMNCEWLDVGAWTSLTDLLPADNQQNILCGARTLLIDSSSNFFVADDPQHLIAAVGVHDLVIVCTAQATLICHRDEVQRIKELVGRLEKDDL